MKRVVIGAMLSGIGVTIGTQFLIRERLITHHAGTTYGQPLPLTIRGIVRCGSIPDQSNSIFIRMLYPGVCPIKCGQWSDRLRAGVPVGQSTSLYRIPDEAWQILEPLKSIIHFSRVPGI